MKANYLSWSEREKTYLGGKERAATLEGEEKGANHVKT